MTKTPTPARRSFVAVLGSNVFFRVILVLLVLQAAWIALSGRYPMAFDENFHLGIIRLYASHISPFWSQQPPGADAFGAVARDPSYLFQYLMSFPYRLITLFTHDQTIEVLVLRAIDIGLFVSGVVLYRRLLLKVGASRALVHACLLIFVLLPIMPLLAAQINYDNLVLPVTAGALLLAVKFDEQLRARRQIDLKVLLQLITVCLAAALIKYSFLPIFAVIISFVIVRVWQLRRKLPAPGLGLAAAWRRLGRGLRVSLVLALLVVTALFVQRYGLNLVRYQSPIPNCGKVLSYQHCKQYGPWLRNYDDKLTKVDGVTPRSPVVFTIDWFYGMWLRTFFAVDGPDTNFQTRGPLYVPAIGSIVLGAIGGLVLLLAAPRLIKKYRRTPAFWLLASVTLVYTAALWLDNYTSFLQTGQPVAINGRYLAPVFLLLFLFVGLAARELFGRRPPLKSALVVLTLICLLWGGGALTYILRSNDAWYWPNRTVRNVNHAVQHVLGPVTPGYGRPTAFMH